MLGGVQSAAAQPEPPAAPDQPARLMLPLMMNGAQPGQLTGEQTGGQKVIILSSRGVTVANRCNHYLDQSDYAPGATVLLTGAGWKSGEVVHIFVNDDAGQTWSLHSVPDPVAERRWLVYL